MKEGIYSIQNTELPSFKIQTNSIDQKNIKIGGGPPVAFLRHQ